MPVQRSHEGGAALQQGHACSHQASHGNTIHRPIGARQGKREIGEWITHRRDVERSAKRMRSWSVIWYAQWRVCDERSCFADERGTVISEHGHCDVGARKVMRRMGNRARSR